MSGFFLSRIRAALRVLLRPLRGERTAPSRLERHPGSDGEPVFVFIDPPFYVNSAKYAHIPHEVTGMYLLKSMLKRIGWTGLGDRKVLDFGCGVRMTRTIINLGLDVGRYHGVDVNEELIAWLGSHVQDPRFSFRFVDDHNPLYNPAGTAGGGLRGLVEDFAGDPFDLAYLYSLITHTDPDEATRILRTVRSVVHDDALLYFTAFLDDRVEDYTEAGELARSRSTYSFTALESLLGETGWRIESVHPGSFVQQPAIVCRPR